MLRFALLPLRVTAQTPANDCIVMAQADAQSVLVTFGARLADNMVRLRCFNPASWRMW